MKARNIVLKMILVIWALETTLLIILALNLPFEAFIIDRPGSLGLGAIIIGAGVSAIEIGLYYYLRFKTSGKKTVEVRIKEENSTLGRDPRTGFVVKVEYGYNKELHKAPHYFFHVIGPDYDPIWHLSGITQKYMEELKEIWGVN